MTFGAMNTSFPILTVMAQCLATAVPTILRVQKSLARIRRWPWRSVPCKIPLAQYLTLAHKWTIPRQMEANPARFTSDKSQGCELDQTN